MSRLKQNSSLAWPIHARLARMKGTPHRSRDRIQNSAGSRGPRIRRFRSVFNAGAGEGGYSPRRWLYPWWIGSGKRFWMAYQRAGEDRSAPGLLRPSLTHVPLPDRSMDLILCTEVLEHVPEHELALDEIARVWLRVVGC